MKYHSLKRAVSVFLFLTLLLCSVGAASSFAPVASAQKTDSTLRVHADGSFRILQIADLQDYYQPAQGSQTATNIYFREINTIRLAVAHVRPDLIVLTGDNIFGAKGTLDNGMTVFEYTVKKVTESFGGVPFIVTFGNHDEESNSYDKNGAQRLSEAAQMEIYAQYGALPLTNDIVPGDLRGQARTRAVREDRL